MKNDTLQLVTTLGASRILKCSPELIRYYARDGRLPSHVLPTGQRVFDRRAVEAFARERIAARNA